MIGTAISSEFPCLASLALLRRWGMLWIRADWWVGIGGKIEMQAHASISEGSSIMQWTSRVWRSHTSPVCWQFFGVFQSFSLHVFSYITTALNRKCRLEVAESFLFIWGTMCESFNTKSQSTIQNQSQSRLNMIFTQDKGKDHQHKRFTQAEMLARFCNFLRVWTAFMQAAHTGC